MSGNKGESAKTANLNNVDMEKLKVLCLHGYRQNSDSFKSKLGSLRKFVAKYAVFTFVTAPHIAPPISESDEGADNNDQRSWWFNKDDGTFKGTNKSGPAIGFEESVKLVEKIWNEEGPFQGLLGFSQGACFVGLLCGLSVKGVTNIKPQFAILSSGFKSGSLVHMNYYEDKLTIPSLHIFGENDNIIPAEMSESLSKIFEKCEIIRHSGGHYLPATAKQKQTYVEFFQDRLQEYLEIKELENATEDFEMNDDSSNISKNEDYDS